MDFNDKKKLVRPKLTTDYLFATWNWEISDHQQGVPQAISRRHPHVPNRRSLI